MGTGKRVLFVCLAALVLLAVTGVASARVAPGRAEARLVTHSPAPIRPFAVYGVSTREQRSELVSEGYDIGERAWPNHVVLYGTKAQALTLMVHGYRLVPQAVPQFPGGSPSPDDFPPGDAAYHNYAEMVADVQAFAAAHPTMAHEFSLGTSYEGRNIIAIRISDDATDNLSEPGVFYVGQHHAREHLTVEVVLNMMHMFLQGPTAVTWSVAWSTRGRSTSSRASIPTVPSTTSRPAPTNGGARTGSRTRGSTGPTRTATTATAGGAAAARAATRTARPSGGRLRSRPRRTY